VLRTLAILGSLAIVGCSPAALPEPRRASGSAEESPAIQEATQEEAWCSAGINAPTAQLAVDVSLQNGKRVWSVVVPMVGCPADKWVSAPNACSYGDDPSTGTGSGGCASLHDSRASHAMVDLHLYWDLGAGVKGDCEATFAARLDHDRHEERLPCGVSVLTRFEVLGARSNPPLNPTVPCVTPLAKCSNQRATRPAG